VHVQQMQVCERGPVALLVDPLEELVDDVVRRSCVIDVAFEALTEPEE
jgi:hypothetical protein